MIEPFSLNSPGKRDAINAFPLTQLAEETEVWWKKFSSSAPAPNIDRFSETNKKCESDLYKNFIFQTPHGIAFSGDGSGEERKRSEGSPSHIIIDCIHLWKFFFWIQSCIFHRCSQANLHFSVVFAPKGAVTCGGALETGLTNCSSSVSIYKYIQLERCVEIIIRICCSTQANVLIKFIISRLPNVE